MCSRQVKLTFTEEFMQNRVHMNWNNAYINEAIGYMSQWSIGSERYKNVTIFGDVRGDLHAQYRNDQNEVTFELFGLRAEDGTYSFHS